MIEFWIDFLMIFEATWLQDNMADIAKTLKNCWFFLGFCYIGKMSWVCGCVEFEGGFLIDFSLIWGAKNDQKSKKSIRKVIKKMIGFKIDFFIDFG